MSVYVYDEATCPALDMSQVADELARVADLATEVRTEFVAYWIPRVQRDTAHLSQTGRRLVEGYPDSLARALVQARVVDPMRRQQPDREPMYAELAAEKRALGQPGRTSRGILYDGAQLQALLAQLIPDPEQEACHIIVSERLVGTFVAEDRRWHAHTVLLGEPCIISTSGLVQAPARPREYYQGLGLASARAAPREVVEARLQRRMADRMLLSDDPRMSQAVAGLILQAVAFHHTGRAFCDVPTCRLFNARRQEELLRSQCGPEAGLCPQHQELFRSLGEAASESP